MLMVCMFTAVDLVPVTTDIMKLSAVDNNILCVGEKRHPESEIVVVRKKGYRMANSSRERVLTCELCNEVFGHIQSTRAAINRINSSPTSKHMAVALHQVFPGKIYNSESSHSPTGLIKVDELG